MGAKIAAPRSQATQRKHAAPALWVMEAPQIAPAPRPLPMLTEGAEAIGEETPAPARCGGGERPRPEAPENPPGLTKPEEAGVQSMPPPKARRNCRRAKKLARSPAPMSEIDCTPIIPSEPIFFKAKREHPGPAAVWWPPWLKS